MRARRWLRSCGALRPQMQLDRPQSCVFAQYNRVTGPTGREAPPSTAAAAGALNEARSCMPKTVEQVLRPGAGRCPGNRRKPPGWPPYFLRCASTPTHHNLRLTGGYNPARVFVLRAFSWLGRAHAQQARALLMQPPHAGAHAKSRAAGSNSGLVAVVKMSTLQATVTRSFWLMEGMHVSVWLC